MKKLILKFAAWTGTFHLPFVDKMFDIAEVATIEEIIESDSDSFYTLLTSSRGHLSNVWIRLGYKLGNAKYKKSIYTHAIPYLGVENGKHMIVEAITEGIVKRPMIEAIGQKDMVMLLKLSRKVPSSVVKRIYANLQAIVDRDEKTNIEYDSGHSLGTKEIYDCSELVYSIVNQGHIDCGHRAPLAPVNRAGVDSYAPIDVHYSDLFEIVYVSNKGK